MSNTIRRRKKTYFCNIKLFFWDFSVFTKTYSNKKKKITIWLNWSSLADIDSHKKWWKEEGGKRRNQGNKELTEQQRTKMFPVRLKRQMAEGWRRRKRLFVVCLFGSDPHIWTSAFIYLGAFICVCVHVQYTCSIWSTGHVSISISESKWDVCL